ncbi:hypothetical protein KGQ72_00530 [Patescibacteria group bacterium]|nr:hypothetical protein [Patescibacteria group bacterium]
MIVISGSFWIPQYTEACSPGTPCVISDTSVTSIKTAVESTISAIKNTLVEVHAATSAAADYAQWTNTFILQPLAFVLSGNLMKTLTASVIGFVIGKANGTGVPQFATDVMASLQTVSDSQALAYLNQFGRNSNSPFAYSIASSLRVNYLQKTSLAGFWAANQSTLSRYSPNVNSFLAGNWSQGGVAAWFALTTQTENNPYTLYQTSDSQMSTLVGSGVGGATGARVAQLGWGQGFMSWCGSTDAADQTQNSAATAYQQCQASGKSGDECQAVFDAAGGTMPSGGGVNPGDPCTNKDGTPGVIKTPGSTIKATLDKVLGGQQDQLVRMGNIGPQINQILGNIATVLQTVQFASQILGGSDSGGLFGVAQTSGSNSTSQLMQYQNTSGALGVTNSSIYQDAASLPVSGSTMLNQIAQYQSAWNAIGASASAASTSAQSLASACAAAADASAQAQLNANAANDGFYNPNPTQQNLSTVHSVFIDAARAQAAAAQTALATEIAPVLAQAAAAAAVVASSTAQVQQLQSNLTSGADTTGSTYSAGIQALQTMPPTMSDVANAQQDSQAFNGATASPDGSLTVSGGSTVDRMSLISTNAAALKTTVCNPNSSLYVTQTFSGG